MSAHRIFLAALTAFGLATVACGQGRLDQVRQEVRADKDDDEDKDKRRKSRRYPYSHTACDDDENSFLGDLLGAVVSGMFSGRDKTPPPPPEFDPSSDHTSRWQQGIHPQGPVLPASHRPPSMAQSPSDQWPPQVGTQAYFAHYPYADGHDGYMFFEESGFRPEAHGASLWFEYGSDFAGLERWTGKLLWEHSDGLNFDGEWSFLSESIGGRSRDELHLGDANLLLRLVAAESTQWFVGGGLNWLADRNSADFGFNMTSRLNVFPVRPIVFSAEVDYGWLGGTDQFHTIIGAGAIWNHLELFAGYDYRRIGSVEFLGPSFGVRYWW